MDYKRLLTQVERTLGQIQSAESTRFTIEQLGETIAMNFRDELGITGGRIYEATDDSNYELVSRFGAVRNGALGIVVPKEYKPLELVLENGVVVMDPTDPGVDPVLEEQLGARRFAAIAVGETHAHIIAFDVAPEMSREDVLFSLNIVRYSMNQRLRAERYESLIVEAQRIQQSILPQRVPQYAGFDIWGKTVPAEVVSGDFYDFIPLNDNICGLAIADGLGHGLPAALVVRDIYMGLRMATDRDFKIIRMMEKLNHIIHRGRLTTKFVSLFYGELETGGILIYSNAGHNYPFLLKGNRVEYLKNGGPVLGPTPDATYTRGFAKLDPGDLICLYSDGITEAHNARDEEFGLHRLERLVKANRHRSAEAIGREVLARVARWGRRDPDDRTVVIVKAVPRLSDVLYFNGRFTTTAERVLGVEDRGFQFGDAVYEVFKFLDKRPAFLLDHFQRMERGLREIDIPNPWDEALFTAVIAELLARTAFDDGIVYVQVTRGESERTHFYPEGMTPTVAAYTRAFRFPDAAKKERGIRVVTTADLRWKQCHVKSVNLLANALAKKRAQRAGADEALFISDGVVREGASSSFFVVKGGR